MSAVLENTPVMDLEALSSVLQEHRSRGLRIVHCHGVFDLLHLGHIRHFQKAKAFGDILVVTLTPDHYVNKGPHRPAFSQDLRAEALAALADVDYVAINQWPTAVEAIQSLKPHVYAKGAEYADADKDTTGGIIREREAIEQVGGELRFTHDLTFSSSSLLNQHLSAFPPEMQAFLSCFRQSYGFESIREIMQEIRNLKVLILGEAIIDEYVYCRTMGKSGKEPILAARLESQERFAGGSLAVANHLAQLCDHVHLISFLGSRDSHEHFIRSHLAPDIHAELLRHCDAPTIVKRRFVENYPIQKLFEVYIMENEEGCEADHQRLIQQLKACIRDVDLVITVDYGHGMMGPEVREFLSQEAPFLALNTQINAGNQGFNTISKYPRADFLCLSEQEIRMDLRQRKLPLEEVTARVSKRLQARQALVTRGDKGCFCYEPGKPAVETPAFSGNSLDRVGAGDTVLALTSLLVKAGAPMEMVGLLGNAVGLQAVQTIGHRKSIDRTALIKFLQHALK